MWQIYVDGTLENAATYSYSNGNLASTYALSLGSYFVLNSWYFDGDIDEIRVWRTALSQDQIRQNMCRKISPVPAELVAYYNFDQASGLAVIDRGSVPTNGTLTNFAGSPWQPSGAPLGDVSTFVYGPGRPELAAANGDLASVESIAQTDGVQLYAVNSPPTVRPATGTSAPVYFGVFSRGSAGTYDFRLRPAGSGVNCATLYARAANNEPWQTTPAAPVAAALLLARQLYRAEYIQAATGSAAAPPSSPATRCFALPAAWCSRLRWRVGPHRLAGTRGPPRPALP